MNEFDQMQDAVEGIELPDVDLEQTGGGRSAGGGGNTIVFVLIVVLLLAFQAASSYFVIQKLFFSEPPTPKPQETTAPENFGQVFRLDGLIVNPTDAGNRHLLVDIGFQTEDQKVLDELAEREPLLRDNLITFFSAQRYKVLTDITLREKLKERVKEIANYNLSKGTVDQVYFIRYVIQ